MKAERSESLRRAEEELNRPIMLWADLQVHPFRAQTWVCAPTRKELYSITADAWGLKGLMRNDSE